MGRHNGLQGPAALKRSSTVPKDLDDWVEIVVADNAGDLLSYLRRRVTEPEDAADLLGNVLLALWEKAARVPTTNKEARMWCFGIARNVIHEHNRRKTKHTALSDGLREHLHAGIAGDNGADTAAEKNMSAQRIRQALSSLDGRSKDLVILVHWDGFSIADAARLLAINESTARTRYGRALHRLQRELGADAGERDAKVRRTRTSLTAEARRLSSLAD